MVKKKALLALRGLFSIKLRIRNKNDLSVSIDQFMLIKFQYFFEAIFTI